MPLSLFLIGQVAVFSIVGCAFYAIVKRRNERFTEEMGLSPTHEEIGGGRFNGTNFTHPFVRTSIYQTFLVISSGHKYVIRYEAIERVVLKRYVFSRGVRLFHN